MDAILCSVLKQIDIYLAMNVLDLLTHTKWNR